MVGNKWPTTPGNLGIPDAVLLGEVRAFKNVFHVYKQVLVNGVLRELHESFWARAAGGSDQYGNTWKKLARVTVYIKLGLLDLELGGDGSSPSEYATELINSGQVKIVKQPQLSGNFTKRTQLTPRQLNQFDSSVGRTKGSARARARKGAFGNVEREFDTAPHSAVPIGVRTGRLAGVFTPANVANNRVYTSGDQVMEITTRGLVIDLSTIPYADDFDSGGNGKWPARPILTANMAAANEVAHHAAITAARKEFDRILATSPNHPFN